MAKLEDEYNVQLDNAQEQIASAVERVGMTEAIFSPQLTDMCAGNEHIQQSSHSARRNKRSHAASHWVNKRKRD